MADSDSWGALSVGVYGDWDIVIDEPLDIDEPLFRVTLDHPKISITFHITSLSVINSLIDFLDNMNAINYEYEIEGGLGASLFFVFDEGRLRIVNTSPGKSGESNSLRVCIYDNDIVNLAKALKDAVESI